MALAISQTQLVDLGALGISGYPFSFAGWFRVPNLNQQMVLMGIGNSTSGSYHRVLYFGNTTKTAAVISFNTSTSTAHSTIAMVPGTWHHVVGIFETSNSRRVYLDGANMGTNAGNRLFDGANQYYLGNINTADTVDVAEAAVFDVVLSVSEVAMLAAGMSPLCLPKANHLLAYQSCIRELNWPARGPHAVAASTPSVVAHPRVMCAIGGTSQVVPNRVPGPFRIAHGSLLKNARTGETQFAGVQANGGQLMSVGSVEAQVGLAEGEE